MKVVEYLIYKLHEFGVRDVFGVPGGVILDFLYEIENYERIESHLSYNEQAASLEACGYAQVEHGLGVAYATKGPGVTNLITGIAEAYSDSLPVLFVTAHDGKKKFSCLRFENEQDLDTVKMVAAITKYAAYVDDVYEAMKQIDIAINTALTGRKGPVFLDFSADIWQLEIIEGGCDGEEKKTDFLYNYDKVLQDIALAERPIILVGDGIRQANAVDELSYFCNNTKIPIISSRGSQDVISDNSRYFGYIGSHGIRYANCIFAMADYVLVLGNRMAFPLHSITYKSAIANKKIVRVDIDDTELGRTDFCEPVKTDIKLFLAKLNSFNRLVNKTTWIEQCNGLRSILSFVDNNGVSSELQAIFRSLEGDYTIVCDIGNNEFWASYAYENSEINNRILYSKSFGTLGCGLPKAIGVYYRTKQPVVCVVGDQGFQFNLQELQVIRKFNLPIAIIVVNNAASGMIRDRQVRKYGKVFHTTEESGYFALDLRKVAELYDIQYAKSVSSKWPIIYELNQLEDEGLSPYIPMGNVMYDMLPSLSETVQNSLNRILSEER